MSFTASGISIQSATLNYSLSICSCLIAMALTLDEYPLFELCLVKVIRCLTQRKRYCKSESSFLRYIAKLTAQAVCPSTV